MVAAVLQCATCHVLGDQEHIVLEQSALHFLALAGLFAGPGPPWLPWRQNMPPMMSLTLVPAQRIRQPRPFI
jgi:hypothetical protein